MINFKTNKKQQSNFCLPFNVGIVCSAETKYNNKMTIGSEYTFLVFVFIAFGHPQLHHRIFPRNSLVVPVIVVVDFVATWMMVQ